MDEVSELESRLSDLTAQISDKILGTNEQIKDIRETDKIKQTAADEKDQNKGEEKEFFSASDGSFK